MQNSEEPTVVGATLHPKSKQSVTTCYHRKHETVDMRPEERGPADRMRSFPWHPSCASQSKRCCMLSDIVRGFESSTTMVVIVRPCYLIRDIDCN